MSAFGKVSYSEKEDIATETENVESLNENAIDKQVNKFDTTYPKAEKLQELYEQYDKITIDEDKIKDLTQVKTNAVGVSVPFRSALILTTTIVVALMLAFLCIYNIFVINGVGNNIGYLQGEVVTCEESLVKSEGVYNDLTDENNIKRELADRGYSEFTSSNVQSVTVPEKAVVEELHGQTNWFDALCNFFSRIFG